jgi:hypothetical protein
MAGLHIHAKRWRWAVAFGVVYVVPQQVFYLLKRGHFEPGLVLAVALVLALFHFFGPKGLRDLLVEDGVLSGPRRFGWGRTRLRLNEIDVARSTKTDFFGGRTIWSVSGEAVHIDAITVSRRDRERLLSAVNLR